MSFTVPLILLLALTATVQAQDGLLQSGNALTVDLAGSLAEVHAAIRKADESATAAARKASRRSKRQLLEVQQALKDAESALERFEESSAAISAKVSGELERSRAQAEADRSAWQTKMTELENRRRVLALGFYVSLATSIIAIIGWATMARAARMKDNIADQRPRLRVRVRVPESSKTAKPSSDSSPNSENTMPLDF